MNRDKQGAQAAWISVVSNLILTLLKLAVGTFAASQALIADGIHSAADVVASVVVLISMAVAGRPADEEHPYGHGKAEVIASLLVAGLLIGASIEIAITGIRSLGQPATAPALLSLGTAAFSLIAKQTLYVYTYRLGKRLNSQALLATAVDHRADVAASGAAVLGIGIAVLGLWTGKPVLYYGDPVAGIIVALLIIRLAYVTGREAIDTLLERNVSSALIASFEECIRSTPGVQRIDKIRARDLGHYIVVDIRIGVSGERSIQEGHDIASSIRETIMKRYQEVQEVLIHINPWYDQRQS
ncbi:MAG: cation transporter [Bacilli bacterium]|nr:cation transporter [Bacilli bacterium]